MKKTQFFADECVFALTINLVRKLGFTVIRAQDVRMSGAKDEVIYEKALQLNSVLITNDLGFSDIRTYPPLSHHGIIVLKMLPDPAHIDQVHNVLQTLLIREEHFEGILFIVDGRKYRKRLKPIKV